MINKNKFSFEEKKKLDYLINSFRYTRKIIGEHQIEIAFYFLKTVEKKKILNKLISLAKSLKVDIEIDLENYKKGIDTLNEIIEGLIGNALIKKKAARFILDMLIKKRESLQLVKQNSDLENKIKELKNIFKLTDKESELLLLTYLIEVDNGVDNLFDELCEYFDVKNNRFSIGAKQLPLSILTELRRSETRKAFAANSNLIKSALLDSDREITDEIKNFLEGLEDKPILQNYFTEYSGDTIQLSDHTISKEDISLIEMLCANRQIGRGVNIILYGQPGTGKTEFARSLGRHLGMKTYEIKNRNEDDNINEEINTFRIQALFASQNMIDLDKSIIIIDEADALLNSESSFFSSLPTTEKGQINKILDDMKSFNIWITNRYNGIDESSKRRFDYSIPFERLTFSKRRKIWKNRTVKHNMQKYITKDLIDKFAENYEVSAGGIDVALNNARLIAIKNYPKSEIVNLVEMSLKAHLSFINEGEVIKNEKNPASKNYSLDGLNIQGDIQKTVLLLDKFNNYWRHSKGDGEIRNMNLLLYGIPGTGKTEFAKYTARRLRRRLIIRRASDLLSMWVGQSEKLIRESFKEAEHDKAVLFIDEADTFLGSRENAARSWEISQVNEFLTNMENFKGMLICATNFKTILDSAAIRRFNIKLKFDYLKSDGNMIFYKRFFNGMISKPLSAAESKLIYSLNFLTPGDFKVVYQQHSFFDKNELSHGMLIESLQNEIETKNDKITKIGFLN